MTTQRGDNRPGRTTKQDRGPTCKCGTRNADPATKQCGYCKAKLLEARS